MAETANIAEKIAKIIAKAESTTHEAEAELFMAKAHAMMLEHGIELADLGQLDQKDAVGETDKAWVVNCTESWGFNLGGAIARYYGCRIVGWKFGYHKRVALYGRESARATTLLMYPYVMRQVRRLAREAHKAGHYKSAAVAATAIGKALTSRVWGMLKGAEQRVHATGHGTALVPVDQIEAFMRDLHGELKTGKARPAKYDPYAQQAAATVSLNLQTGGTRASNSSRITHG
jgi:hypothetical protein